MTMADHKDPLTIEDVDRIEPLAKRTHETATAGSDAHWLSYELLRAYAEVRRLRSDLEAERDGREAFAASAREMILNKKLSSELQRRESAEAAAERLANALVFDGTDRNTMVPIGVWEEHKAKFGGGE
jgi:hypothetical protein